MYSNILKKILNKDKISYVDIGASGDLLPRWKKYNEILLIFAFEPILNEYKKLKIKLKNHKNIKIFNYAIADRKGKRIFNETVGPYQSSFLIPNYNLVKNFPNQKRFDIKKRSNINCKTLNSFKEKFDFIKIDTQGFNYNILVGGADKIKNTLAIEIEAEFIKIYKNQKLFEDSKVFLEKKNFIMIDFLNLRRWSNLKNMTFGRMVFGNVLFIKNPSKIIKNYTQYKKLIIILIIYNKLDYALTLIKNVKLNDRKLFLKIILMKKRLLFIPNILFSILLRFLRIFNKNLDLTLFS